MSQTRAHTEAHKSAIRQASALLHEERVVGNYIRKVNRALYEQLLREATHPRSAILEPLIAALEPGNSQPSLPPPRVPQTQRPLQPTTVRYDDRKPPPIMDIK